MAQRTAGRSPWEINCTHSAAGGGALVELARQGFDGEDGRGVVRRQLVVHDVDLRLGEHGGHAASEQLLVDALDVVAVDEAEAGEARNPQDRGQLALELPGLSVEAGFLLYVHTRDHGVLPFFVDGSVPRGSGRPRGARTALSRRIANLSMIRHPVVRRLVLVRPAS